VVHSSQVSAARFPPQRQGGALAEEVMRDVTPMDELRNYLLFLAAVL
jgi:hypothetical protein